MNLNEAKKGTDYIMKVNNPKFEISAVSPKQYPKNDLPQIVLVGKSNVGKSSFINTMINRKSLARTSSEPGKTRQINFYNIDEIFYFVDLPGYGYSKMSKQEQERVGSFIEQYLVKSKNISLVIFLIIYMQISSIACCMPIGVTSLSFKIVITRSIFSEVSAMSSIVLLSTFTLPFIYSIITISIPYLASTFSSFLMVL